MTPHLQYILLNLYQLSPSVIFYYSIKQRTQTRAHALSCTLHSLVKYICLKTPVNVHISIQLKRSLANFISFTPTKVHV